MARKLRGFQRVLDAPALFAVAYGEIASSIYFALGIVALHALGFTPLVLFAAGLLFLLVSLSYAEGTAAIPETGGAATFVRRAYNDALGFITGWALFLDYLIVIALSTLFLPHYLAGALAAPSLAREPWDVAIAIVVVVGIAIARLARRSRLHTASLVVAGLDLGTQMLLVIFGIAFLFSPDALTRGVSLSGAPGWGELAFALPLAMLAYTGLETVANLAEETREPGVTLPRSMFSAIGLLVGVYVLLAVVALSAFPVTGDTTAIGTDWLRSPLVGIVEALRGTFPDAIVDVLRGYVGLTGALILLAAATTSITGFTRLAHSLGEHGQLPRAFGRLNRRTLVSPHAIVAVALISIAILLGSAIFEDDVAFLASLFSFGVLLAFTAAQLAVIRLRIKEPDLERPFRAPFDVRVRGHSLPLPALVGAPLTFAVWVISMATHPGARYAGPAWLLAGLVVYGLVRLSGRHGLLEDVQPIEELPPGADYRSILVPMKLGDIGEEMVATAIALAKESEAQIEALFVIKVPLSLPIDAELAEQDEQAATSLAEAAMLGEENGVKVTTETIRARSIAHAIVNEARERGVDLIVLGSSPRWRRQSAFFSPTVDAVLRNAPCEVLVVAFPEGVFEQA
jgi:basic amino acid/polyamine antiporter, APA family